MNGGLLKLLVVSIVCVGAFCLSADCGAVTTKVVFLVGTPPQIGLGLILILFEKGCC